MENQMTSHRNGGKKRCAIWRHFNDEKRLDLKKRRMCQCNFCGVEMKAQPDRMSRHLLQVCTVVNAETRAEVQQNQDQLVKQQFQLVRQKLHSKGKHLIWQYFHDSVEMKQKRMCKCSLCEHLMKAQPERMIRHIAQICTKVDQETKSKWTTIQQDYQLKKKKTSSTSTSEASSTLPADSLTRKRKSPTCTSLKESVNRQQLAVEEMHVVQEDFVIAMLTSTKKGDWIMLNNFFFQRAINTMIPNFDHIDSKGKFNAILDRLQRKVAGSIQEFVASARYLTLCCDSYVNRVQHCITRFFLVDEHGRSELIDAVKCTTLNNRDRNLQDLFNFIVAQNIDSDSVLHFCCNNSRIYFPILKHFHHFRNSPFTLLGGCASEQSNLFLKQVMLSTSALFDGFQNTIKVAAFIKCNSTFNSVLLNSINIDFESTSKLDSLSISIPNLSNWCSNGVLIKQMIYLKYYIQNCFQAEENKPYMLKSNYVPIVKQIIFQPKFWHMLTEIDLLLSPFYFIALSTENNFTSSGQILALWIWIIIAIEHTNLLSADEKVQLNKLIWKRFHRYCEPHFLACALLDPRVNGIGLSAIGKHHAQQCILQLAKKRFPSMNLNNLASQLSSYVLKHSLFSSFDVWKNDFTKDAGTFWRNLNECQELKLVALLVLSYKPYCASTEENWSSHVTVPSTDIEQVSPATVRYSQVRHHYHRTAKINPVQQIGRILFSENALRSKFLFNTDSNMDCPPATSYSLQRDICDSDIDFDSNDSLNHHSEVLNENDAQLLFESMNYDNDTMEKITFNYVQSLRNVYYSMGGDEGWGSSDPYDGQSFSMSNFTASWIDFEPNILKEIMKSFRKLS